MATELQQLRRSLDGLHGKLNRLNASLVRQKALCEGCRPDVEEHERILKGHNGTAGLAARVASLERFRKRAWSAVCALAGTIASLVAAWLSSGRPRIH